MSLDKAIEKGMSDILIKGIELPKGDRLFRTVKIFRDGTVVQEGEIIGKVVEVKPHGRLVDADEFITELRATINKVLLRSLLHNIFVNDESVKKDTLDGINFVLDRLENAPTVLEASEWKV